MKKSNIGSTKRAISVLAIAFLATGLFAARPARAEDRWLHVRVDNQTAKGEMVRINVPLEVAEKVLPAIHNERLHNGKVTVDGNVNGVDLRALLDAVRSSRDGEFVTMQGNHGDMRVVKQAGYLLVHVRENKDWAKKRVEIRVPITVVDALLSAGNNELDLVAAVRALAKHGDTELITVKDDQSTVRIWLDSKNTSD